MAATRSRLAALAALAAALACARATPRTIRFADRPPALPGDVALAYADSAASGFLDRRGRPCRPSSGHAAHAVIGWQSPDDDPLCVLDTVDSGPGQASLELRYRAVVPADGDYDLLARRQAAGAWGRVEARGSWYGQFFASAEVVLEASAPTCRGSASVLLGKGEVTGPWNRAAGFGGWVELPDLVLKGCRAGEPLELRVRLAAGVNRGRVEVDGFGVAAGNDADVARAFSLRRREAAPPSPAEPALAPGPAPR